MSFRSWTPPPIGAKGPAPAPAATSPADPVQAAYARGLAEGNNQGAAAVERRLRTARQAIEKLTRATVEAREAVSGEIEETVTVLALAVAQRVVVRELQIDPATIADLVRVTIATLPPSAPPVVRINPEDLAALREAEPLPESPRNVDVEWLPDASMERGGYVVETPQRVLDGRLTSVFRDLYERLRDA